MQIIDKIIDFPNKKWGEDRIFSNEYQLGVLDGSTPIDLHPINGFNSQAEWLVDLLSNRLNHYSDQSVLDSCHNIIENNKNHLELNHLSIENQPCTMLASVEEMNQHIVLSILGDCKIVVQFKNGIIQLYSDLRIEPFVNKTKQIKQYAIDNQLDVKELIKNQMFKNRQSMNTKDGFWTIAFKGDFKSNALLFRLRKDDIKKILIFSDGFERTFLYTDIKIESVLNEEISLQDCLNQLRNAENNLNSEVKKSDDASCILLSI